jgi:predicted DNA-binding protein
MQTVTFKAPQSLVRKLRKFSNTQDRTMSYLVRKAVEEYIAEMEEDEADYKIAMERLENPGGDPIPWEEVKKKYGLEN